MLATLLSVILKPCIKKEKGLNLIPKRGPFIIVSNHSSYIDGVLLYVRILKTRGRKVRFVTEKEWYYWLPAWPFLKFHKQIPVGGAVAKAEKLLKKGEAIGIFPEAGRTRTGKIQIAKHSGTGVLALLSGSPVIPIGLKTFEFWPRQKTFPKFKKVIEINVGKGKRHKGKVTKTKAMKIVHSTMRQVARLAGQKYGR